MAFRIGKPPMFSVDAFVRDLEAVVDTLGFDRFALIGSSKGGATAMAYAARHPERVSHLVLCGAFAQGWRCGAMPPKSSGARRSITLTRQGWAQDNPAFRQILTSLLLPDATLEETDLFNDLQRISASAENAARLQQSSGDVNVLDLLPGIVTPTLVLHCSDDAAMPFAARPADRKPHSPSKARPTREPQPRSPASRSGLGCFPQRGTPVSAWGAHANAPRA